MARTGRPPVEHPRDHTLRIRLTAVELQAVTAAAEFLHQTRTEWARGRLLAAAKRAYRSPVVEQSVRA